MIRISLFLLLFACLPQVQAQDFVYTPINTSFGGSYLNYSSLLNGANQQNTYTDPKEDAMNQLIEQENPNQKWDDLADGLENRIVDAIQDKILEDYLGEDGKLQEGSFTLGDFNVDIEEGLEGFFVNIEDGRTGGSTRIDVPFF
ncbi:curli assembly protein CsgF [Persicobacter psychrovividus]|uniref:Curli production assembly/transport component CsgF n=1 Tax=Persicobacter psychrovividus TaxID=387638 RepID=A0ABM7VDE8_9BACT|nr:curli production assembly protein CsgF [Persicobacter psychrovividus]